jgi:hypothetical protein
MKLDMFYKPIDWDMQVNYAYESIEDSLIKLQYTLL